MPLVGDALGHACICLFSFPVNSAFTVFGAEGDIYAWAAQMHDANMNTTLYQDKPFSSSKFGGSREANVNTFNFVDHVRTRSFLARIFGVDKYRGDFQYDAQTANLGNRVVMNGTKNFDTKIVDAKPARESGKVSAPNTKAGNQVSEFRQRGVSQDRLDKEGPNAFKGQRPVGLQGNMHPMTIDEVRTLLNTNK